VIPLILANDGKSELTALLVLGAGYLGSIEYRGFPGSRSWPWFGAPADSEVHSVAFRCRFFISAAAQSHFCILG
jgi:hypothetical protein